MREALPPPLWLEQVVHDYVAAAITREYDDAAQPSPEQAETDALGQQIAVKEQAIREVRTLATSGALPMIDASTMLTDLRDAINALRSQQAEAAKRGRALGADEGSLLALWNDDTEATLGQRR